MKIIIDAMGGDNAPMAIVQGCVEASNELNIKLCLVGREEKIEEAINTFDHSAKYIEIINAADVIESDDNPTTAIRKKKNASMIVAVDMLKENPGSVVISAGNTGALMAAGLLRAGRIKGIDRPALAPMIPTRNRKGTLLLDVGANTDCRSKNLLQFAIMGSIYVEKVLGRKNATVALLNIGTEENKGTEMLKEAYALLRNSKQVNFVGNIEPRDVLEGKVDVIVCDGFVGNVTLKLIEGVALSLFGMMKEEFTSSTAAKIGAMILKPKLKGLRAKLDYTEYGGAPLLGVNGGIIKAHGSSDSKSIKNAIRQGKAFIDNNVLLTISGSMSEMLVEEAE